MSDYYDDQPETEAVAVDDRLTLMREFVDMEAKHKHLDREQKRLAEQSHKLQARMREVRGRLGEHLGFNDGMAAAKASLNAEVEQLRANR